MLLGGEKLFGEKKDNSYNPSDPFFVVTCKDCGKEYWSIRRANSVCMRCGSKNISTNRPGHTIEKYKNITK